MKHDPNSLVNYFLAQEKSGRLRAESEAAGARLDLAKIQERLAEITSQHEPLATLAKLGTAGYDVQRSALLAAASYVVIGRMPEWIPLEKFGHSWRKQGGECGSVGHRCNLLCPSHPVCQQCPAP